MLFGSDLSPLLTVESVLYYTDFSRFVSQWFVSTVTLFQTEYGRSRPHYHHNTTSSNQRVELTLPLQKFRRNDKKVCWSSFYRNLQTYTGRWPHLFHCLSNRAYSIPIRFNYIDLFWQPVWEKRVGRKTDEWKNLTLLPYLSLQLFTEQFKITENL